MKDRRTFIKALGVSYAGLLIGRVRAVNTSQTPNSETLDKIYEVRRACKQFALQYFHFCKNLVETLGEENALPVVQKTIFELSLDRSDRMRKKALENNLEPTLENFRKVSDLAFIGWSGWDPSMGGVRCPYAEIWLGYYEQHPWFKRFASLYCDVIDTTNIENFTRTTSHKITKNLLWGDDECVREYFESSEVKAGIFTYGKRG
jgi:hypothetical protein